jgi:peroxiredoxin
MSDTPSQQQSQTTALQPGITAPDFTLRTTPNQSISLNQYRGNPVILVFYPADFSPVCGDEMTLFNELLPEFHRLNAEVMGVSVDGVWCHLAFSKEKNLKNSIACGFRTKR